MTTMMMCGERDVDDGGGDACMALVATHCCSRSYVVFMGLCVFLVFLF